MKLFKQIIKIAFLPIIISILTFYILSKSLFIDERSAYEKYLNDISKEMDLNLKESNNPDAPEMAAFQDFIMTVDPKLKYIPIERLWNAFKEIENKKHTRNGEAIFWQEQYANMGGRMRCLTFDPNDSTGKTVWAGSATGGLWFNTNILDSNSKWQILEDIPNLSVSCIAFDPDNPDYLYVGTGEVQTARVIYRESSSVGSGLWKIHRTGSTVEQISSTKSFTYITDIEFINQNNKEVIYLGVASGFYKGVDFKSQPSDGLYRSEDKGTNWTQVLPNISGKSKPYAVSDIEYLKQNNRIFIGTMKNLDGDGGATILHSDNGQKGSWTVYSQMESKIKNLPNNNVPGRVVLSSSVYKPNKIYAMVGAGYISQEGFNYAFGKYILKSEDAGQTWKEKVNYINSGNRKWASLSWHAFAARATYSADTLILGGLDLYRLADTSFRRLSDWAGMYSPGQRDYVHADIHDIEFVPNPKYLNDIIISTDGGVFYAPMISLSNPIFYEHNQNLNTLQFYSCDIYPNADTNYLIGGLQDNGSLYYDGNSVSIYNMVSGGDGAYCFFDQNQPNIFMTSVYYNRYYVFNNFNFVKFIDAYSGMFINPADYNSNTNSLFANATSFGGQNLDQILRRKNILFGNDEFVDVNTGAKVPFSSVKVSPNALGTATTLFLGTQSGELFKVENAHKTPTTSNIGNTQFPTSNISCIEIGHSDDSILVTFSNYGVSSVWLTYNGGKNWKAIESNLPDIPIRWAIFHPQDSRIAMLATEIGVYQGVNLHHDSIHWEYVSSGHGGCRTDMLKVRKSDNTVVSATHGRGMYIAKWKLTLPLSANFKASATMQLKNGSITFSDLSEGNIKSWYWEAEGSKTKTSTDKNPTFDYDSLGMFDVKLTITDIYNNTHHLLKENYISIVETNVEETIASNLKIYPTMSHGTFLIQNKQNLQIQSIEIFDAKGNLILNINHEPKQVINISENQSGLYFIKIKTKDFEKVEKVFLVK